MGMAKAPDAEETIPKSRLRTDRKGKENTQLVGKKKGFSWARRETQLFRNRYFRNSPAKKKPEPLEGKKHRQRGRGNL